MGITIPANSQDIFDRIATDIITELNELDPYLRSSLLRAISVSDANAFFEIYKTLEQLQLLTFWDTTSGEDLDRWASIWGLVRNPATISTGNVSFTGINTAQVPINTQFTAESGELYQTTLAGVITNTNISVSTITRVSETATATTPVSHGYASSMQVTISGAIETEYNGLFVITVTGFNTFTYTVAGAPSTPATGTITSNTVFANVPVESLSFGQVQNLKSGAPISLSSPIAGVDNQAFVSFSGIDGGTDVETDDELRDRFLFRIQNPIALFNESGIIDQARKVSGVTRVFVQTVDTLSETVAAASLTRSGDFSLFTTASPHGLFDGQPISVDGADQSEYNVSNKKILVVNTTQFGYVVSDSATTPASGSIEAAFAIAGLGQVRVFFVRDNDSDIIPSESEVADVRDALLLIKPAPMSGTDLIVAGPSPIVVDFVFSSLSPNTESMQTAIIDSLTSYFSTGTTVGQDLERIDYESVINATLDANGNIVNTFTLSTPTTTIPIASDEIPILGTITFP